jgi:glycerol-3-phosphate O-acyltransferase
LCPKQLTSIYLFVSTDTNWQNNKIRMKLPAPFHYIAQKLLYLWVRTDVIRAPDTTPDKAAIVIYVVESRAWSDLLVLDYECKKHRLAMPRSRIRQKQLKRWHHVYTVAQASPLKAWLSHKRKHSSMLTGIRQILLDNPQLEVQFVPVVIFWGRPVLKQKHWLRVLFSETWGLAGRTRRFFTILFNGKNTLLQFSPAISYRDLLGEVPAGEDAIHFVQDRLSQRLNEIRAATLGPDISHRRTLVKNLLENDDVIDAINRRSEKDQTSRYKTAKIANKYLNEIVADRSYITIQILQRILTAFWNKFYSGINVHFSDSLKSLALDHELIYVPCHRSHIDYLLLSYVIHNEGLAIPYIAAGKNLNMPLIGPVLRKGGAFFIRRSFKGNELYSTVLFEYLASQIASGMPIEYFVEGGRSRTGRLLQPRVGMLAMTIRGFLKYQRRPIAFVPVYIGYEKMIEGKAYLAELAGDDKKSETLFSSVRSLISIRGFYGRTTTNFGEAILLDEILNQQDPSWQGQIYDDRNRPPWFKPTVNQVAHLIMQRINECCAVNAVNLVATVLLASPNQTMDEVELKRTLSFYRELIRELGYSDRITLTELDADEQIQHAEKLGLAKRRQHAMGDFIYLDHAHAVRMTYYRNNILHLMILPSLIASCFNNVRELSKDRVIHYVNITYPFLKREFFLPWSSAEIEAVIDKTLRQLKKAGLLSRHVMTRTYERPDTTTEQHAQLSTLANVISPLLELYYMIFALLAGHDAGTLDRKRLEQLCYLMAQRLSLMYQINSPDFFDKRLIGNFINSLLELGYLKEDDDDRLALSEIAYREGRHARRLLDKNMQYNILQMLRSSTEL